MEIGIRTALALLALFLVLLHGIAEMSEEIKTNFLTTHQYETNRLR